MLLSNVMDLDASCRMVESEYPSLKGRKREQVCYGCSVSVLVIHICSVASETNETKVRVEYVTNAGSANCMSGRYFDRLNFDDRKCVFF